MRERARAEAGGRTGGCYDASNRPIERTAKLPLIGRSAGVAKGDLVPGKSRRRKKSDEASSAVQVA